MWVLCVVGFVKYLSNMESNGLHQGSRSTSKIWSPTDYMTSKKWSPNHFFLSPVFVLGL